MVLAEPPAVETTLDQLMVQASALRAALATVEHATSKDEDRPVLTTVLLSAHNGHLYAVAADNYRIAEAHIDCVGSPDFLGSTDTLIGSSDRPSIMAWLKSVGKDADVSIHRVEGQLVLAYGRRQLVVTLMDGPFPSYRKVMDDEVLPPVVFTINPAYLADAGKAMAGETILQVRAASPLSAVHFRRDGYREVVMPVRVAE